MVQNFHAYIQILEKKKQMFKAFFILCCLGMAFSFPTAPWRSISVPLGSYNIAYSMTDVEPDGNVYTYVLALSTIALNVYSYNCSVNPPHLLAYKMILLSNVITSPVITPLNSSILISFSDHSAAYVHQLSKATFSEEYSAYSSQIEYGVYLKEYGYLISIRENLRVIDTPESLGGTVKATYISGTTFPEKIKYLISKSQGKHITLYSDLNFFEIRTANSDVNAFASGFSTPTLIYYLGCQCACFSPDQSILYIFDIQDNLLVYNLVSGALSTSATIPLGTEVVDCYFETAQDSIVLVDNNFRLNKVPLTTMAITDSKNTSASGFHIDETNAFVTTHQGATIDISRIRISCSSGSFYNMQSGTCMSCATGCFLCLSQTNCTQCESGYSLDNNTCVNIPVNASGEKTTLEELLISLLQNNGITFVNRIPGGRKVLPFLSFLINIDELWLYQYHERDYGELMNTLFESVQKLENQKWKLLEDQTTEVLYAKAGTSKDAIYGFIDTKLNYTSPKFREVEDRGETFLPACWEFVEFNLVFVLLGFLLVRWGARLLRRWKIAQYLRPFRTVAYLTPLLLDGNLQYFFFLLFSQVRLGFSLNPRDKMLNVLNYLLYFLALWASVVSCFLAFWTARRLSQYLLDNWRTRVRGLLAHSLSGAVRALVLGALHSLLRDSPLQLPLLLGAEVLYVALLVCFMGYWRAHRVAFRVCFTVSFALLRIALQGVLIVQQRGGAVGTGSEVERITQGILGFILAAYFFLIYCGVAWSLIFQILDVFKSQNELSEEKKQKKGKKANQQTEEKAKELKREKKQTPKKKSKQGSASKKKEKEKKKSKSKSSKKADSVNKAEKDDKNMKKKKEKEEKEGKGKANGKSQSNKKRREKSQQGRTNIPITQFVKKIENEKEKEVEMKIYQNKKQNKFLMIRYIPGQKE